MKKKVLILGPDFYGYINSLSKAFNNLDFEVKSFQYYENFYPFNYINLVINKVGLGKKRLRKKSLERVNQVVVDLFDEYQPDLVFVYNGNVFYKETFDYFRTKSKVALWMLDSIFRYENSPKLAATVDALFCFEQTDVDKLNAMGIKAHFLPAAFNPDIYYPANSEKDIDIFFLGALYGYPKRVELLSKIADRYAGYKLKFCGIYKPIYKVPLQWLFREKRAVFTNKNVPYKDVNALYNHARIVLNIHHSQSQNGANPKVFEITGSGAFQIVDWNPYIASLFPNNEVAMYKNEEELFVLLDKYVQKIDQEMAEKAYQLVIEHHTFKHRIQQALQVLAM